MLVDLSRQHALPFWAAFGARFEQVLVIKAGGLDSGSRRRGGQDEAAGPNFTFPSLAGLTRRGETPWPDRADGRRAGVARGRDRAFRAGLLHSGGPPPQGRAFAAAGHAR